MMSFFNHYSALLIPALLLVAGVLGMRRRPALRRRGWILGAAVLIYSAGWLALRPVARSTEPVSGQPLLLEVQSPYCLGCVALKPIVDRLENQMRGRLTVRRVDIQSNEGRQLVEQYGIEFTPTFLLFDRFGKEHWRGVGHLDAARVRAILEKQQESQ